MTITDVATASGMSARMIHYYERRGMMGPVQRTASGDRVYYDCDVQILDFIQRARDVRLSIDEIAGLLALWRSRHAASEDVKACAVTQVRLLSARAATLAALIQALLEFAAGRERQGREDYPFLWGFPVKSQTGAQTAGYKLPSIRGH